MEPEFNGISFIGAPGIGKGYSEEAIRHDKFTSANVQTLKLVTTRPARSSDVDRIAGVPVEEFMQQVAAGEIVMAHQPFSATSYNGRSQHWYGYYRNHFGQLDSRLVLSDPNLDQIATFRELGVRALIIGLVDSSKDLSYLRDNMLERGDAEAEVTMRLKYAAEIQPQIDAAHAAGEVNYLLEVGVRNKTKLARLMVDLASDLIRLGRLSTPSIDQIQQFNELK